MVKKQNRTQKGGWVAALGRMLLPMVIGEVGKKLSGGRIRRGGLTPAAVRAMLIRRPAARYY